jgi:hypothetical protein
LIFKHFYFKHISEPLIRIFNTVYLENNPFTLKEVQTLLEGITVGGHKLEDQQQVLNQSKRRVNANGTHDRFFLSESEFPEFHNFQQLFRAFKFILFYHSETK